MNSQILKTESTFHASIENSLMPEMPVMNQLHGILGEVHPTTGGLLGLQHLFGSTASLIHRIAKNRISPDKVFLLGKPYSTNPRVAALLQDGLGYWVHPDSVDQSCDIENDSLMDQRICETLEHIASVIKSQWAYPPMRFLLIDDGGRAIRLLHSDRFGDIRRHFTCVEQTRCGIRAIADLDLEIPVINVAESWVKLEHESPLIATSVNLELSKKLIGLGRAGISVSRHALVIGYGSIGKAVAEELACDGRDVAIFDNQPTRLMQAAKDGYRVIPDLSTALRRGGVIVGCTGLPVLDNADYPDIAAGSLLISASSADVEFRAWNLRARGECLGDPSRWTQEPQLMSRGTSDSEGRRWNHPCFSLYRIGDEDHSFYLVNGGFPVNFNGGVDPIRPSRIQLTRSLLLAGAVQASHTKRAGLHDLSQNAQILLMEAYSAPRVTQVA